MNKDYLKARFPMLMLVFAFGGIFGFVYEEIYGFGAIIILGMTFKFRKNPFLVFLFATIASGVLELVTGWVILKFFGVRLWDYNTEIWNWGNINGFVCLRSVLFFGVSGVVLQFILMPLFAKLENKMPRKAWLALCFIPSGLFILDIVISLICKAVK